MIQIEFDNNQIITVIQANSGDLFKDVLSKYLAKTLHPPESVSFLANGSIINPNLSVEKQMSNLDKANKTMKVIVNMMKEDDDNKVVIKSKQIICPKCKEPCRINLENFKIKLYDCINGHINDNINLIDFNDSQQIDLSKIKCDICKENNKGNSFNNEFYFCLHCKQNLCPICKAKHEKENNKNNIINYEQKFFVCQKHNDFYVNYCNDCQKNLCLLCIEEHRDHNNIFFSSLIPNVDEIKESISEIKSNIERFINNINTILKRLQELMKAMEIFYDINLDILNNYEYKNRNYQILKNINEINVKNPIFELIKEINENKNMSSNIFKIINLYERINSDLEDIEDDNNNNNNINNFAIPILNIINNVMNENINIKDQEQIEEDYKINEMTIIYNINKKDDEIKLFDNNFVENNKDKCHLIIDDKKCELCDLYELNDIQKKSDILVIKLIETKLITNMSCMFLNCSSLNSILDITNWNTAFVKDMSSVFYGCKFLKSLPDISNWNTSNVTNMSSMFFFCSSLKSLPDISKWNTSNVTDMSYMFYNCKALISLPDISKWNTSNISNMKSMFEGCNSLKSFPRLKKWDIKKLTDKEDMFKGCKERIIPSIFDDNCLIF